ncbi:MAG: hypothetical protein ACJAYU_005035 [Bradymonadia bacterium]|jgi:hypothetical protein
MSNTPVLEYVPAEHWELGVAEALLPYVPADLSGAVLVAPAGVGVFARLLATHLTRARRFMVVDPNSERLDDVREALGDLSCQAFYAHNRLSEMQYASGVFEAAFCLLGPLDGARFRNRAADFATMVEAGGVVGMGVIGDRSFSVVEQLLREEAFAAHPHLADELDDYLARRLRSEDVPEALASLGLEVQACETIEVRVAASPETLLTDHIVAAGLAPFLGRLDQSLWEGTALRLRTYFADQRIEDRIELHWFVARVPLLDVDESDVLGETD